MFAFHECEGGLDFNLIGLCCFVNIVPDAGRKWSMNEQKCRLSTPEHDVHTHTDTHTERHNRGTMLRHTQTHGKLNNQLSSMLLLLSSVLSAALCSTALLTRHHFKQFGHFNIFTLSKCFVICLSLSPSVSFKSLFFLWSSFFSSFRLPHPVCAANLPLLWPRFTPGVKMPSWVWWENAISTSSWRLSTTWH